MKKTILTVDGTFELPGNMEAVTSVIYVSGTLGTAVVNLQVPNGRGGFSNLADGAVTDMDTQYVVTHGRGVEIFADITSADGTTDLMFVNASIVH